MSPHALLLNARTTQRSVSIGAVGMADSQQEAEMLTLDAQVHAYERNHPGRPWVGTLYGPAEVTGDQMVAAMDAVGVDGAVLVSPFSMYRYDASYAKEVYAAHPNRFRLVKPVDPEKLIGVVDALFQQADSVTRISNNPSWHSLIERSVGPRD